MAFVLSSNSIQSSPLPECLTECSVFQYLLGMRHAVKGSILHRGLLEERDWHSGQGFLVIMLRWVVRDPMAGWVLPGKLTSEENS